MDSFKEIWNEISDFIRENEKLATVTSALIAEKIGVSAAQISRIRNGRSNLSNEVVDKIVAPIAKLNRTYAENVRERLKGVQFQLIENRLVDSETESNVYRHPIDRDRGDAIRLIEGLFDTLVSAEHAILCVEFRDNPRAGTSPKFAKLAGEAVCAGRDLCVALFQPYGSQEERLEIHNQYMKTENPDGTIAEAYLDLWRLAGTVRSVYREILTHCPDQGTRVALYEAKRTPVSLCAIGMQSRLFYTRSQIGDDWKPSAYNWVTSRSDGDVFVELSEPNVSMDVIRAQFRPVAEWGKPDYKLMVNDTLDNAYNNSSWCESGVRWKNWSPPATSE